MENSNRIVPPHLNAEVYRTDITGTSTQNYLDYVKLHPDGTLLVGCSELTGRYWNGGARIIKKNKEENFNITSKKDICLISGTADGCFVEKSNKVLICEDTGAVSLWTSNDDAWQQWTEDLSVSEHDNAALAVDCLKPSSEYVTVGADGNIKVWDIADLVCIRNYSSAHSKAIYGVAVKPGTHSSFATGSLDYYVSLWDENNTAKPVLDLLKNCCGVRCLQWLDENKLVFGDESGVVGLIDVRNSETFEKLIEFPTAVHKLAVNLKCDRVAVCCDNKIVSVLGVNEDKAKLIYENKQLHSNHVRGPAWNLDDENVLHTVGWDGELKNHIIS